MKKIFENLDMGLIAVLVISLLFVSLYMFGFMRNVENLVVDAVVLLTSDGDKTRSKDIVYAHTSQRGLKEAEKIYNMGWPWRRAVYAKLIDFFNKSKARVIVFDSIFSEKSVYSYLGEQDDRRFADSIGEARNAIIGMVFYLKKHELKDKIDTKIKMLQNKDVATLKGLLKKRIKVLQKLSLIKSAAELEALNKEGVFVLLRGYFNKTLLLKYEKAQEPFLKKYALKVEDHSKDESKIIDYFRIVPPIKKLQKVALQVSSVEGPLDADGKARRTPLLIKYWGGYYPSLSFATVYHYLKPSKVIVDKDKITLDDREIPLTRGGNLRLKFYGTRHIYPTYYQIDIIRVYDYMEDLFSYYNGTLKKTDIVEEDVYKDYKNLLKLREIVKKTNPKLAGRLSTTIINRINTKAFKDKIVLLGSIAPGMFDQRATPFSQTETGVHIHATAIDNILNNDVLQELRETWLVGFLIFILPWFVYISSNRLPLGYGIVIVALFILAIVSVGFLLYTQANILMDIGSMVIALLLTFPVISILKYFKESKQKKYIKGVFGQYLSPAVIDVIMDDPDKLQLGGVNREITSFFSDIEKFSTISEKLNPPELVALLNDYLTEMCDIIIKYDGVIDKFEGDAIIAFWGAPLDQKDHATRAINAVIEIQEKMLELSGLWKEHKLDGLKMRMGVNSGEAVVGNMGSRQRMDYTMIGDTVNLAARLEGVNKFYGTYTMISEHTYKVVKDIIEVREVDRVRVVGKSIPVTIYEVLGRKGAVGDTARTLIDNHVKGYSYYMSKDFKKAQSVFQSSLVVDKNDALSKLYIDRCEEFIQNPPQADWDGVTNLDKK